MICIFCKGTVSKKKVEEEVKVGVDHILVQLDAEVCNNCHERYFPEGTVDYLQKLRRELKTKKTQFKAIGQVFEAV